MIPPPQRLYLLAHAVALLGVTAVHAGVSYEVSPAAVLDTRDPSGTAVALSAQAILDTRQVDGLSGYSTSGLALLDTRTLYPLSLAIVGPSLCPAGGSATFQAIAQYGGSSTEDVSAQVVWKATGSRLDDPPGSLGRAVFYAGRLTAGLLSDTTPIQITATYKYGNGALTSASHAVIIGDGNTLGVGIGLRVGNGQYLRPAGGGTYVWQLMAIADGQVQTAPGVVYQWHANDVLVNETTSNFTREYTGTPGTLRLKVVATDSLGRTGTQTKLISLQRPALNEPGQKYRASQPEGATLAGSTGQLFQFDAARIPNGLIVLTHGMRDSPDAPWLIGGDQQAGLATAIEARLLSENKPVPNIVIFGWEYGANPLLKDLISTDPGTMAKILKMDATVYASLYSVPFFGWLLETLYDFQMIKGDASAYATALAQWIQDEAALNHIDVNKPMHFIGHSAGGFVVSGAAYQLKNVATVTQVTMLDTPLPDRTTVMSLINSGTHVERYVSSALGACAPGAGELPFLLTKVRQPSSLLLNPLGITRLTNYLEPGTYYHRQILTNLFNPLYPLAGPNIPTGDAHNYSHDWYITSAQGVVDGGTGFGLSPFMTAQAPPPPANQAFAAMSMPGDSAEAPDSASAAALDGFTIFGTVTGDGAPYVLTEDTNAGIEQTLTLPVGADALQFRYQFTTAGDGDFIAVYFDDNPPLFIGPDVEAARTAPMEVNVPLQGYEGQSGTLVIKLVSQGQANAVAQIDQITLTTTDDPDHDALTNDQEQTLGTHPLLYDTDSDGIGDWEEVNTTLTNPLLADSDGDGLTDAQEIIAGTSGVDAASVFRTNGTTVAANGDVTVTWAAKAGKTYRVQRSDAPDFANYTVVGDSIPGVEPTTNFTDTSVPGGTARMFYRVEVE